MYVCAHVLHCWLCASIMHCVYVFMRLWVGLIFRDQLSFGPSPSGGATRFPSLETVKTVTSPTMPTLLRQCEYSAGGCQGAQATTPWPFHLERAFL